MSGGPDDPFGRRREERTDPFGNPLPDEDPRREPPPDSFAPEEAPRREPLWLPPEGAAAQTAAPAPAPSAPGAPPEERHGGFLPPTDAPAEPQGAWWAEPAVESGAGPPQAESADWLTRVLAAVIDFFIRLVILGVFAGLGALISSDGLVAGAVFGGFLAIFVYAPVLLARWDGQTVGHRVTDTRIVMTNGERMSGGRGFVREVIVKNFLIEGVGQFTLFVLPLVNYLWPLWDERNEALHDKICNTRVIRAS